MKFVIYTLSLLTVIYDFPHSKSSPVTSCHSTRSILASTSQPKEGLKPSTVNLASLTSGFHATYSRIDYQEPESHKSLQTCYSYTLSSRK